MAVSKDVKKLLTGSVDDKLEVIERRTSERIVFLLGLIGVSETVPHELEYVAYEVTLKRFNRIGNEGMQSYSQEGESMTFPDSDFDEYADIFDRWRADNEEDDDSGYGKFHVF